DRRAVLLVEEREVELVGARRRVERHRDVHEAEADVSLPDHLRGGGTGPPTRMRGGSMGPLGRGTPTRPGEVISPGRARSVTRGGHRNYLRSGSLRWAPS